MKNDFFGNATLEEVMSYRCSAAVGVFRRKYLVSEEASQVLWLDLLKWLWLGALHPKDTDKLKPKVLGISTQLLAIDEMWHSFILCTQDYHDFCFKYFGCFLHHVPGIDHVEPVTREDIELQYCYVVKNLGDATAFRWYLSLPIQYQGTLEKQTFTH